MVLFVKLPTVCLEKDCVSHRLVRLFNVEKYVFRKRGYIQPVSMLKALSASLASKVRVRVCVVSLKSARQGL